ncbi:MAG: hypothetical protein GX607_10635 [Myxococcales bacterium]|nr:hypothetical protein [Myxococcales bacterium]
MATTHPTRQHAQPAPTDRGRDEMNLIEFPFATLSRRATLGSIRCERWITDPQGQRHRQLWTVQGGSASGLPTEFDERVYVALMAVTRRHGFTEPRVPFSVYGLLRIMGESTDSRHYQSVERSLERLLRVSIVAEGAFWDREKHELVELLNGFHLIERYWLAYRERDRDLAQREGVPGYIVWGAELWRSIRQGYLKDLDLRRFYALQTPVARRLYRFLDKKLHRSATYEIDIFQFAQQLGMSRYAYPAKVREKLQPGIDELVAQGFLAASEVVRVRSYTRVRFTRRAPSTRTSSRGASPLVAADAAEPVERAGRDWRRATAEAHGIGAERRQLWERVLRLARKEVSDLMYRAWLARSLLLEVTETGAVVLLPNPYAVAQVRTPWDGTLRVAMERVLARSCALTYRAAEKPTEGTPSPEDTPSLRPLAAGLVADDQG